MLPRPSNHEICKKVADALDAVKAGRFQLGPAKHISPDCEALNVDTVDLPGLVLELLDEIQNAGPIESYVGHSPPLKSYEDEVIKNQELWEYVWHSTRFGKLMYLKFVLKKQCYIFVRCHENSPHND